MQDGNSSAPQFYLRTRAKDRGYSEHAEAMSVNGKSMQIRGALTLQALEEELPLDSIVAIYTKLGPIIEKRVKALKKAHRIPL